MRKGFGRDVNKTVFNSAICVKQVNLHPLYSTMDVKEFDNFVLPIHGGNGIAAWKRNHENSLKLNLEGRTPEEARMAITKVIFEEKWKQIRSRSTARWSLMAEYDLNKVDKSEVKFDKFVTMLQVKYGFTKQQAREEVNRLWMEYEAKNKV